MAPGHVSEEAFSQAALEARSSEKDISEVLIEKDVIKDDQLGQIIAEAQGVPLLRIREEMVDESVLHSLPEAVARARGIILINATKDAVRVAMRDPQDRESLFVIEKKMGKKAVPMYLTKKNFQELLSRYKADIRSEFNKILLRLKNEMLAQQDRDSAIVDLVGMLLEYGYQSKASDVHIEPHRQGLMIRFRIDGVMHDILEMPKEIAELVLTRIKVLAKLRTDEHRAAQDGKLLFEPEGEQVDVRVSIVPVTEGENVVMRLLSSKARQMSLTDIGLSEENLKTIHQAIDNPHGMILVTGPTGSGKTTTVYGMLKILNTRDVHISTIEDPVEYEIEGISQIQVNVRTNLTFAKGLRAIVRQDPDIIMVGEIRDEETADIAVNSAMTGHLVLSTLHANDAATTLPRLLDMGIEPFLVASTVNIVIAQRLVRRICEHCRESHVLQEEEKILIDSHPLLKNIFALKTPKRGKSPRAEQIRLYKGAGCSVCAHTGYMGRIGIFELLETSEEIKQLIAARADSDEIMKAAKKLGMKTMMEDGVEKALAGVTTLEEVVRAAKE